MGRQRQLLWLFLMVAFLFPLPGCDLFNRVVISPDGKVLYFAVNKEAGFVPDETSEVYAFYIEEKRMVRLTEDQFPDVWPSVSPDGKSLLFVKVEPFFSEDDKAPRIYFAKTPDSRPLNFSGGALQLDGVPEWMDSNAFLFQRMTFAIHSGAESHGQELSSQWAYAGVSRDTALIRELHRMPYYGDKIPETATEVECFSTTLPVWRVNKVYFSTAKARVSEGKPSETVDISIQVNEGDPPVTRTIASFSATIARQSAEDIGKPLYAWNDLAVSPDEKKIVCVLLHPELYSDSSPSRGYLIDAETGEVKLLFDDTNAYYPQWSPDGASFLFLSGAKELEGETEVEGRRLMVWEVEGSTKRQLLFYPGKYLECYTGWTWLSEERLRAFHLAEGGLWITDINPHGTEKSETHYTRAELLDMKSKADTEGPPWAEKGSRLPEAEPAGK